MSRREFDPIANYESARRLTDKAIEAFKNDFYDIALGNFKKSNRLLIKVIAGLADSKTHLNLSGSYIENKLILDQLVANTYGMLADNNSFILLILCDKGNFSEAKPYIKSANKYFNLASEYFNDRIFYSKYLNTLIDSLVVFQNTKDYKEELFYLKKYLNLIAESSRQGFKPDSGQIENARIALNRYLQLIEYDEEETRKSIDFLYDLFFNSGLTTKEKETIDVYNFSVHNLENMIFRFPIIVDDNEPKLFEILKETVTELITGDSLEVIEDESYLQTLLNVLNRFSISFQKPDNLEELYQLNLDIVDAEAELGRTNYVINALVNALNILSINYDISTNFRKLKIHNRLLGLYGVIRDLKNAQFQRESVEELLYLIQLEDALSEDYINTLEQAENELNLIKAESYYFLASNEVENNKTFLGLKTLQKCLEHLKEVSPSYESSLKDNLSNLMGSLNDYIHNKLENEILI